MKNLLGKFSILALVLSLGFLTSCDEDPVVDPVGPSISFVTGTDLLDADTEVAKGATFSVKISLSKGDAELSAVKVYADNVQYDDFTLADVNGDPIDPANNPFTLQSGNEYTITIVASTDAGSSTTYAFEVSDQGSLSNEVSLTITTPATTDLNVAYTAVILNNTSGPAGSYGSLDLDTGVTVASSDTAGDIRDEGINNGAPSDDVNWYQQIKPVNGAAIRLPDFSAIEGFTFDDVDSREALAAAYDSATDVTQTAKLATGDMFMALVGEDYYLIQVGDIVVTAADNFDNYTLNIKGSKKE